MLKKYKNKLHLEEDEDEEKGATAEKNKNKSKDGKRLRRKKILAYQKKLVGEELENAKKKEKEQN